jgi:hypothetical protein
MMLSGGIGASGGSSGTHDDSHSPRSTPSSSADLHLGGQSPGGLKSDHIKHESGASNGHDLSARAQLNGMFDASTEAAMQMAAATANVDPFGGIGRGNPLYAGVGLCFLLAN